MCKIVDYKEEHKKLLVYSGLKAIFKFKGSVSNLATLYKEYDYLLQPTHMECFSLSILESLAANILVITTPVGGNKEVITHGENGYLFKIEDVNSLSVLLKSVIKGEMNILGNTRNLVELKFSIDAMVNNHFQLLK